MSGNFNSQRAQLLHQPPHLGTAGADLVGDLGSAHHHGGVFHQQSHNAPKTHIRALRCGIVGPRAARPLTFLRTTACGVFRDAGIMRERDGKNKCDGEWGSSPAGLGRCTTGGTPVLHFLSGYAGITRKLISTAAAEWVSAPTEMKSTPVSA